MRTPYDRFAKDTWTAFIECAAPVETEVEVAADTQRIDLTFGEADPTKLSELERFGLLARIVKEGPGQVEFFHSAPGVDEALFCIQKQTERRRRRKETESAPHLWIVTAGRPTTALNELGFVHDAAWPRGVYRLAPGFLVTLIVVSELPQTPDTLPLRIVGAGAVLSAAMAEVDALPTEAPERDVLLPAMLRLLSERGLQPTAEDREFYMNAQAIVQQWKQGIIEEGREKWRGEGRGEGLRDGVREGVRDTLTRLLRLRFGVGALDVAASNRIASANVEELRRWTERILTAERVDDVFREA
jgi:hypothetical protein